MLGFKGEPTIAVVAAATESIYCNIWPPNTSSKRLENSFILELTTQHEEQQYLVPTNDGAPTTPRSHCYPGTDVLWEGPKARVSQSI